MDPPGQRDELFDEQETDLDLDGDVDEAGHSHAELRQGWELVLARARDRLVRFGHRPPTDPGAA